MALNILVTGGAGYIGTTLIPVLLDAGHAVTCYDILAYGAQPILPFFANPRFSLIKADVRDALRLREALHNADAIIHLASIVGAPACAKNPDLAYSVNVEGTRLLNDLRSPSQMLVFSSTGSVYGKVTDAVCTESTPVAPLSDYGQQKALGERMFLERGGAAVLRFATIFGLSPRLRLDLLPNDFTYRAIHEGRLEIYEAEFKRTFLSVKDAARAFLHVLTHYDRMCNQVFNAGDERLNMSKLDLAQLIRRYVDYELVAGAGTDVDQRDYDVSYRRIRSTGFEATVTLEDGVAEMARAFPAIAPDLAFANV